MPSRILRLFPNKTKTSTDRARTLWIKRAFLFGTQEQWYDDHMHEKFLKPYDPSQTEDRIYALWESSGFFNPDVCTEKGVAKPDAPVFSVALPPPNVTGVLHLGHAFENSLQDAMVRFARMRGKRTLWIPGTDHAAIATQEKVEKIIYKQEGKTRYDLGRDEFLKRVGVFAQESHDTIVNQVRKMGASLDWSREAYTLDETRSRAVRVAFQRMYDAGLIYRGDRVVNWDPKLHTTVSDDEVEWVEERAPFYYLTYGPFTIATARPETKFGDKYVVMHPDDPRYKNYTHGQKIDLEWINGPVTATVIKDKAIDMEFGTGVMTITPWHDATDFEIALRHQLDKEQIIDLYGKLLPVAGEFAGLHIKKARPLIVQKLKATGLLKKVDENYAHRVAANSRGGGLIEPQIMRQWFVSVHAKFQMPDSKIDGIKTGEEVTLKDVMRKAVESGQIQILPERFEKVYFHWIDNLRDWCISRQIWFGHRIPVWYRGAEIYVGIMDPKGDGWERDPDTLDTWFSSALWTFSTLGWPEETADLKKYHPTSVIDPGYEILFFWVARMILMSGFLRGEVPFRTAYIHGILRDAEGRKFSKSLGNGIDPLEMIERYGADALRMALVAGVGPGNDSAFSEQKVKAYKLFANKLWNIARFVLSNADDAPLSEPPLSDIDRQRLDELRAFTGEIAEDLERYHTHRASEKLYHYVWHTVADVILEERKVALGADLDPSKRSSAQWTLLSILGTSLKLLHPFMPFITEEIWQHMPAPHKDSDLLLVAPFPTRYEY